MVSHYISRSLPLAFAALAPTIMNENIFDTH